ncbi:acyl-CoA dehydrogenase family protein [Haloechinothrix aidingensis]|uniref:acyl-CoA dehydrogenase family protein n=1 Tax=Haloechinothrix aidingensis TaxID=2752311 RepID=UPI001FE88A8E|nr:acyl-CoA dehydrogenase family protein [Haloechinothrix aidingensis]
MAGVATLAAREDDDWLVTGQKVWTSGAHQAHFALLLARTDPDVPKHRGMTMFIVDMSADGVEVRPLRQADGGARFSEVFLTDVRIPDAMRLGPVGDGWGVALRVLQTERSGASDVFIRPVEDLLDSWRGRGRFLPAAMRDDVVKMWMDAAVFELSRNRQRAVAGTDDAVRLGAIAKVAASEHAQRLSTVMAAVLGPDILTRADYDEAFAEDRTGEESPSDRFAALPPHRYLLRTRAMSIEGGTNEISRNIISERVLGLPADIRVDKDRPWRELTRS